ncbi:MAG: rod shape-determining protein MreC [Patescibacteria group bacterium]|nr:rod shape-determining protein MreC [Patescibacteria group bacterium]
MKRTFLAKRNSLLSSSDVSWGALALGIAILILFLRLLAPNLFWKIFTPVFGSADALATKSHVFISSFSDKAALALENERLSAENAALASENTALAAKAASVSALVSAGAKSRKSDSGILASVVARPPESPYDTLVLAAGKNDGVALGQEAFGIGSVPLGVVSFVTDDFSRITLFSTPGMTIHGWVGRGNLPLSIEGSGGGTFRASLPRSAGVLAGDTVYAPGEGALPIGTVARIDGDPSMPEVALRIAPALNPFSITWVLLRDTGVSLLNAVPSTTPSLP